MCLAIPYKVISVSKKAIELEFLGRKRTVRDSLIKIKPGDFVLLQKNTIIRKVPKKEAQEILKMISLTQKESKVL